jgi:hypothetical protein
VVCETDPFRRQLVQAGRGIEGAIAAQVTPAGVVDKHEYDIWFVSHDLFFLSIENLVLGASGAISPLAGMSGMGRISRPGIAGFWTIVTLLSTGSNTPQM